jgi:hypothetical protein
MFLELHSSDMLNIKILESQLMLKCLGAINQKSLSIIKSEISDSLKMLPASFTIKKIDIKVYNFV